MRWSERAQSRLRNNEVIEETIAVGENGIVVTNQRLLAFTPDGDGANYRAIERPNVEDAALRHGGDTEWLEYTAKGGLAGLVGVGLGLTVDFGGMLSLGGISTSGAGAVGMGGIMSMLNTISSLMNQLDDALLVGGLLALTFGLGAFGMYIESREYNLVVDVAGEPDLYVKAPSDAQDQDRRLQRALDGESREGVGHEVAERPSSSPDDRPATGTDSSTASGNAAHEGTVDDPIPVEPADRSEVEGTDAADGE